MISDGDRMRILKGSRCNPLQGTNQHWSGDTE